MQGSSFPLIVAVILTMGQYHIDCKFLIHPYNLRPTILINFADTLPIFRVRPSSMTLMFVNKVVKLKSLSFANISYLLKNLKCGLFVIMVFIYPVSRLVYKA